MKLQCRHAERVRPNESNPARVAICKNDAKYRAPNGKVYCQEHAESLGGSRYGFTTKRSNAVGTNLISSTSVMNDVTKILAEVKKGNSQASDQLLPIVYNELRKLATQRLAQERPGQTLPEMK